MPSNGSILRSSVADDVGALSVVVVGPAAAHAQQQPPQLYTPRSSLQSRSASFPRPASPHSHQQQSNVGGGGGLSSSGGGNFKLRASDDERDDHHENAHTHIICPAATDRIAGRMPAAAAGNSSGGGGGTSLVGLATTVIHEPPAVAAADSAAEADYDARGGAGAASAAASSVESSSGEYGQAGVSLSLLLPMPPGHRGLLERPQNWWETAAAQPWDVPDAADEDQQRRQSLDVDKLTQSLEALAAGSSTSSTDEWQGGISDSDSGSDVESVDYRHHHQQHLPQKQLQKQLTAGGGAGLVQLQQLAPLLDQQQQQQQQQLVGKASAAGSTAAAADQQRASGSSRRRPERENLSWVDLVRTVASCLLFLGHALVPVSQHRAVHSLSPQLELPFLALCQALVWLSAPMFVLSSGYLLLPRMQSLSAGDFYRRRLPRLLAPAIAWSVAYYLWTATAADGTFSSRDLLRSFTADFFSERLWFVNLMFLLYAVTPLLAMVVQQSWQASPTLLLGGLCLWLAADPILSHLLLAGNSRLWTSAPAAAFQALRCAWVAVYVLGGVLSRHRHSLLPSGSSSTKTRRRAVVTAAAASGGLLLSLGYLVAECWQQTVQLQLGAGDAAASWRLTLLPPPGLPVSAAAAFLFVIVRLLGQLPWYSRNSGALEISRTFGAVAFGMYLVLPLVVDGVSRFSRTTLMYEQISPLAIVPVFAATLGLLAFSCAALLKRLPAGGFIASR